MSPDSEGKRGTEKTEAKCPFSAAAGVGTTIRDWWPKELRLDLLHQHSSKSDPMGQEFDYAKAFKSLDLAALKKDLTALRSSFLNASAYLKSAPSGFDPAPCWRSGDRSSRSGHQNWLFGGG